MNSENVKINISKEQFLYIIKIFRCEKAIPKDNDELKKLYVSILKNIFGTLNIIKSVKKKNKQQMTITIYNFNDELISKLFKLIFVKFYNELDEKLINLVGVEIPLIKQDISDDALILYKFGKHK